MSHITNILLRFIQKRIRAKIRLQKGEAQFVFFFFAEKEITKALFTFRVLMERNMEVQKDVFACFVVYEKTFDKVRHAKLFEIIKESDVDVDERDLRLMKNF